MTVLLRCQDSHQLLVRSMDRARLKLPIWICRSCTGFSQQMGWMRVAMHSWEASADEPGKAPARANAPPV